MALSVERQIIVDKLMALQCVGRLVGTSSDGCIIMEPSEEELTLLEQLADVVRMEAFSKKRRPLKV